MPKLWTHNFLCSTWETVRRSSEQALLVLDHEEDLNIHDEENDDKPSYTFPVRLNNRNNSIRLHAAPRYATAIFRCCYTTCSIATAWICFSSSNFWPPQVGGSWGKAGQGGGGRTAHCWNLKGSPGMAEDFDGLDALLKFYYLLQASYHVHSGAFHILTMILLWNRRRLRQRQEQSNRQQSKLFLRSPNSKRHGWASTKPFTSYGRSILQHGIALLLIAGSHLFASTRRLGAIGSFVLDVSSWFLHALQVCINAPVPPLSPAAIQWVHHCIVIPVFVYCRFYIWPFVVWRSAMFESTDWLKHMESTMFPGIYQAMMWVFTALAAVLLGLNIILFQRLVHHPHLQRVFETQPKRQRHSKLSAT
jgi:TLC domain